jgi:hypothetical protein
MEYEQKKDGFRGKLNQQKTIVKINGPIEHESKRIQPTSKLEHQKLTGVLQGRGRERAKTRKVLIV